MVSSSKTRTSTNKKLLRSQKNIKDLYNIISLYIINNKYIYNEGKINNIDTKLFSYYVNIKNKNIFKNIFRFNNFLKIFLYKYVQKRKNNNNIINLTIKYKYLKTFNFSIIDEKKVNIKLDKNKYFDIINIKNNEYTQYLSEIKKIRLIKKVGINLKDKTYTKDIDKIIKNIDFGNSLNFVYPYKVKIKVK